MENWASAKRLILMQKLPILQLRSGKELGMIPAAMASQVLLLGAEDGKSILGGRVPLIGVVRLLLSDDMVSFRFSLFEHI